MNKDNAKDFLPLVQALADGKVIQMICSDGTHEDLADPSFVGDSSRYRIKPEPKEIWMNRHMNGDLSTLWYESKEAALFGIRPGWDAICFREVIE